ncbi:hypothetical protein EC968_004375 [Mortierella alpina]|nr:hypothetical protein EC968_004375 [Mortierella alpina]
MKTSLITILLPLLGVVALAQIQASYQEGFQAITGDEESGICATSKEFELKVSALKDFAQKSLDACSTKGEVRDDIQGLLEMLESMENFFKPKLEKDCEDSKNCNKGPSEGSEELATCNKQRDQCNDEKASLDRDLNQCRSRNDFCNTQLDDCKSGNDACNTQLTQCNSGKDSCNKQLSQCNDEKKSCNTQKNSCFKGHIGLTDQFTCLERQGDGVQAVRCTSTNCDSQNFILPSGNGPIISPMDGKCLNAFSLKFETCTGGDNQGWVYTARATSSRQISIRQLKGSKCIFMRIPKGQERGTATLGNCEENLNCI